MKCKCGNIISNIVFPCSTEGSIISQQNEEVLEREFVTEVKAFLSAVSSGRRDKWLVAKFGKDYPKDLSDADIILDLYTTTSDRYKLSIAECEKCGRIWIQETIGKNRYCSFSPDQGGYTGLLSRNRQGNSSRSPKLKGIEQSDAPKP